MPDDRDLPALAAAALPAPNAQPVDPSNYAARVDEMIRRFRDVDFDPDARAAQLGAGVEPAFNYVRDHIRYEAYAGAFRGAGGTYRSRAGNAADRALLLARLLKAKGIETRFVTGMLPQDKAELLFQRIFAPADAEGAPPAPETEKRDLAGRIRARAARDYAAVRNALGESLPAHGSVDHDTILREIAAHAWLQAKSGDNWVDLDPAFPDAAPGKTYAPAGQPVDALPEDAFQRITLRVIVERLEGGSLTHDTVLELTRPATDVVDKQVFVLHGSPADSGGVSGLGAGGQPSGLAPMFSIDGEVNAGKPIEFETAKSSGGGGGGALGGFGGFGGALGGGAGPEAKSQFVAEYLEFELSFPGGDRQTVRRTLVDRGSAAWRLDLPLDPKKLQELEKDAHGPLAAQVVHNAWISGGPHDLASFARAMQVLRPAPKRTSDDRANASGAQPPDPSLQLWLMAMKNLACLIPSDHWFLPALQDEPAARFYLDSPRILLFSLASRPDGANRISVESEIDWRRDRIRGVAKDPASEPNVAKRKIWYGLLEGALEHEIAVETGANPDGAGQPTIASTSASFGNQGLTTLSPADAGEAWASRAHNRETAARISAALKAGDVLVVPKEVLTGDGDSAWWAVSRDNADTRAVWGPDINATISRSPWNPPPDNTGGIYQINPDGSSIDLKNPQRSRKGAGNEYGTLVIEVSMKNLLIAGALGAVIVYCAYVVVRAIFF